MQKNSYLNKMKHLQFFKTQIYCIDSSAIINLFRHGGLAYPPYPRDVFKGLWEKIEDLIKKHQIISHITVFKEIGKKDDEIKRWCYEYKEMFKDVDECQINKLDEIKEKYSKSYWDAEINRKGQEWADPWIIALAMCEEAKIISDEKDSYNRIPYIAKLFGIQTLNLMDFLREIGLELK